MKAKTKFLNSIITSAQDHDIAMPWTRGPARRESIARRRTKSPRTTETSPAIAKSA